jgi:hypothetical protein
VSKIIEKNSCLLDCGQKHDKTSGFPYERIKTLMREGAAVKIEIWREIKKGFQY